ncbi:serine/arginine repetitive matrix protein 2 isoform X1 [Dendroctonus ponderosae]|uniref:Uncharacterized protein n=2 Tax=Dendroctonus ponderosae TaxID=77166 RepID=U4UMD1_DENPD|nr:serine/arginine repetitive matrix protein 2 isoform X1 [Dendroctonus ponderosae]XP_048526417.1 serine/arginine repetitive matrix protein 2 isoform X1 [Dendroctonus ponderosae]ERL91165.1 hypothetical protein D910_08505 [Dendroctonus ponderosae]
MELVSPVSTALSHVIKNMHPQGASASLSQAPHIPQGLTNMHPNTTAAHNYTNQHTFSLNITSTTTGPFSQSQEQAPASNHPVANPGGGQTFIQKSNNVSGTTSTSPAPVPVEASVEMPLPEKSQSNGTSEDGPPQLGLLTGNSVAAKDKPTASESLSEPPAAEAKADAPIQVIPDKPEPVEDESSSKLDPETEPKDTHIENEEKSEPSPKAAKQVEEAQVQTKSEPDCIKDIAATPETDPLKTPIEVANQQTPKPQVVKSSRKVKAPQDEPKAGTSMSTATAQTTAKRQRLRTQHYQSPLPEVEFVSKISTSTAKSNDEKLMVFYKSEFLAVRNAEGGFYLCQTVQNIYKTSSKIKIRWLSQTKSDDKGEEYTPDFYDLIDFDCILTNLSLNKADKGKFILPTSEKTRTQSILNRSLAVEKGEEIAAPSLTAEHPDGLDLSLYRDEDQLKKRKSRKRPRKASPAAPQKELTSKKTPKAAKVKKPNPLPKRTVPAAKTATASSSKAVAPVSKPASKISSKAATKASVKSNPVVDQKKAKMIARIGRKAALAAASKSSTKSTSPKNGKSGKKTAAAPNKAAQPKTSLSAKTTTRSLRKSTRK